MVEFQHPALDISKTVFTHSCKYCRVVFQDNARNTRFCTAINPDKECQKKYSKIKKARKAEYDENHKFYRAKVQAHTLARMVLDLEVLEGRRKQQCEFPGCECLEKEKLEVHHRNVNIWDCRPENLSFYCKPHHAIEQSLLRTTDETKRWFYKKGDEVLGPLSYEELLRIYLNKEVKEEDLVSREGNTATSDSWKPLSSFKEFEMENPFIIDKVRNLAR